MPKPSLVEGVHTAHVDMNLDGKRKRPATDRSMGIEQDPTIVSFLAEIEGKTLGKALFETEERQLRKQGLTIPVLTEISQALACGKWPDITLEDGTQINSAETVRKWYYDSVSKP